MKQIASLSIISEYNFGGENASATIAMMEALGCYADKGVYLATLWGGSSYQYAGINLYTNYNKKGGAFGDLLIPTLTDDVSLCSAYAALSSTNEGVLTISMTNKSETDAERRHPSERHGRCLADCRGLGCGRQQQDPPAGERCHGAGRSGAGDAARLLCGNGRASKITPVYYLHMEKSAALIHDVNAADFSLST